MLWRNSGAIIKRVHTMSEWLPGYDAWKLQTPPEYDEPEERDEADPDRERDEAIERDYLDRLYPPQADEG